MIRKNLNRVILINKNINDNFAKYIENTSNICLYKLGNHYIPKNIIFDNANTLTLINCNNDGIHNILHPSIFPNLNTINYLSMAPNNNTIHNRFSLSKKNIKWVFPNKNYDYYNYMVESGYGVKDCEILKHYICNKKMVNGGNSFDISFEVDIIVPDYGIINGEWWCEQFYEYLLKKQKLEKIENYKYCMYPSETINTNDENEIKQEFEESQIQKEFVAEALFQTSFDT
jgi:hypothetical protein